MRVTKFPRKSSYIKMHTQHGWLANLIIVNCECMLSTWLYIRPEALGSYGLSCLCDMTMDFLANCEFNLLYLNSYTIHDWEQCSDHYRYRRYREQWFLQAKNHRFPWILSCLDRRMWPSLQLIFFDLLTSSFNK